jgi:hypothetical protein
VLRHPVTMAMDFAILRNMEEPKDADARGADATNPWLSQFEEVDRVIRR